MLGERTRKSELKGERKAEKADGVKRKAQERESDGRGRVMGEGGSEGPGRGARQRQSPRARGGENETKSGKEG